jgi:membrane protein
MSWKELWGGLKSKVTEDDVTDIAAAVTYYGFLALFPFVLLVVALASVIITPDQAEQLVRQLSEVAPGAVTQIVGDRIRQLGQQQNVTLVGFGAVGAIWAASGALSALMRALNTTYDVKDTRPWWKRQGLALLMTVVCGVLALVGGLVAIAAPAVAGFVGGPLGSVIVWLRLPVAGLVMMFLWALMYWALPDVEQDFKFITPGSVVGVVIWVIASWGFSLYVSHFGNYDKTYGSIAGVIVLLFWMWISSVVLLFGAELNAFVEHASPEGKRQGAKSMADQGTTPATGGGAPPASGTAPPGPVPRWRRVGLATAAVAFAAGVLLGRREGA